MGYLVNPVPGGSPERLVMPRVASASLHVNGPIRSGPFGVTGPSALASVRFTDDGSALVPFGVGCTSDGSFIANCPDAITGHLTQAGGPTGSEVEQTNGFLAVTFAATESVDLFADVLLGSVESNSNSYVSGATLSSMWTPTVYREDAYLPASVRSIIPATGRRYQLGFSMDL